MARRWLSRCLFALAVPVLLVVGAVTGVQSLPLLPFEVSEAAFSMLSFGAFVLITGGLFVYNLHRDGHADAPPLDETVTAIIPAYEDADVLDRSVESLLDNDHDVEVRIVCEADDERGLAMAGEFAERARVDYFINENPGSKAGAINDAVERADGDVFAVFDADQEVPPDFIEKMTGYLRDADVVQGRFLPRPTGVVESLAYYEYALFNYCFRQPLYATSDFRMATSKALLFTREAFETVGGYDPDVVAEDCDFGHRCYLAELDVRIDYLPTVREESAHSLSDWWGQRKRWMVGNVQVLRRLLSDFPAEYRRPRRHVSLSVAISSVGGAIFMLSLVPKFTYLVTQGAYLTAAAPLLALYAVGIALRTLDEEPLDWYWLFAPAVLPLFSLITLSALTDYVAGVETGWFTVEKSE